MGNLRPCRFATGVSDVSSEVDVARSGVVDARRLRRIRQLCVSAIVVLACVRVAVAQDALIAARELYKDAMYEDALVRLNSLRASAHLPGDDAVIERYRAFCLLALGRATEADAAIEAVVRAAPSFSPRETDASPRVRSAFSDVRRRILPGIVREQYTHAKQLFDQHEYAPAKAEFQLVIDLLDDPDLGSVADRPPLGGLRTLAAGFLDLSAKFEPPTARSVLPSSTVSPLAPAATPPAPPPAAPPAPGRIYSVDDPNVVAPVVIRQSWSALNDVFAVRSGVVAIVIDENGAVVSSAMTVAVNPVYDRLALSLAKGWRYRPATVDGVAVKFRKIVSLESKSGR
jgi:hypothetical protein